MSDLQNQVYEKQRPYTVNELMDSNFHDVQSYMRKDIDNNLLNPSQQDFDEVNKTAETNIQSHISTLREFTLHYDFKKITDAETRGHLISIKSNLLTYENAEKEADLDQKKEKKKYSAKKASYGKKHKTYQKTSKTATVYTETMKNQLQHYFNNADDSPMDEEQMNRVLNFDFLTKEHEADVSEKDRNYDMVQEEYVTAHIGELVKQLDDMRKVYSRLSDDRSDDEQTIALNETITNLYNLISHVLTNNGIDASFLDKNADERRQAASGDGMALLDKKSKSHVKIGDRIKTLNSDFLALKKTVINLANKNVEAFETQNFMAYYHRVEQTDEAKIKSEQAISDAKEKYAKIQKRFNSPSNIDGVSEYEKSTIPVYISFYRTKRKIQLKPGQDLGEPPYTDEELSYAKAKCKGDLKNSEYKIKYQEYSARKYSNNAGEGNSRFVVYTAETYEPRFFNIAQMAQDYLDKDTEIDDTKRKTVQILINQVMDIMGQRGLLFSKEFFLRSMTQAQQDKYNLTGKKNKGNSNLMMIAKPDYLNDKDLTRKCKQYLKEIDLMTSQLNHLCSTISAIYLDKKTFGEGMILDEFHEQELTEETMLDYWKLLRDNAMKQAENNPNAA